MMGGVKEGVNLDSHQNTNPSSNQSESKAKFGGVSGQTDMGVKNVDKVSSADKAEAAGTNGGLSGGMMGVHGKPMWTVRQYKDYFE